MPHMTCVKCEKKMIPDKSGVWVIRYVAGFAQEIFSADRWKCPVCELKIVAGFGLIGIGFVNGEFDEYLKAILASDYGDSWEAINSTYPMSVNTIACCACKKNMHLSGAAHVLQMFTPEQIPYKLLSATMLSCDICGQAAAMPTGTVSEHFKEDFQRSLDMASALGKVIVNEYERNYSKNKG